ncbi:DUF2513 domain-containing protein [Phaeobacter piscinae]|uniref:DUF2513 domain-containing protein n=1 Tax=Phaeobacter piscinae TaxID=1580596 RepID=UPI000BBECFA2|nr:DUF2513 domain-containing protein [Phaeobacter piscinae]ATG38555.1 hypothetical protein PhaeoP14_00425 [Phaeobacter piscinae]
MKRDMDVIRNVLLELEKLEYLPNGHHDLRGKGTLHIEGVDCSEISAHLELLLDAGLYKSVSGNPHWQKFRSLTWEGCDFLDSVRDDQIWAETKKGAAAAGSFTFDLLKALAKGFIKKKIKEHTDVDI